MRGNSALVLLTLALTVGSVLRADQKAPGGEKWWSHIEALANDGMAGRLTGSPEHKRAAEYVARQFETAGLERPGIGGYLQPVRLKTRRIVEAQSSLTL